MNITRIEKKLIVIHQQVGVAAYDFKFELHFSCDHPYSIEKEELCILRMGAITDYEAEFHEKLDMGLRLVNSLAEHTLASELEAWYPLISDLTPRTMVFGTLPSAEEIEAHFQWPVFLKGSRQTSKHNPELSIIQSREHYAIARQQYQNDAILHWQKPVIREFIPLLPVAGHVPGKVQPSVEYRSFWWHGECVGWGRYWSQVAAYECPDAESGLAIAKVATQRLGVPFLVIDFAKTRSGQWIIIECNDAQESGYAGVKPQLLWRNILEHIGR